MDQYITFKEFYELCKVIETIFEKEWRGAQEWEKQERLNREKRAIIGYAKETEYYRDKIKIALENGNWLNTTHPPWYKSLEDGIFAELYGLSGLAPWAYDETEEYRESSSAKLIGDRLYCLIEGKSKLQPQRISGRRREQLKRALLLSSPKERLESGFHEVYLHNGIRISIFSGDRTKEDQEIMVFRKYVLRELTFEKMAELGTIPAESVELFKTMVKLGFNVMFAGAVRTGKTSFMQCWQRYEDRTLEGLAIATDPETPWHELMPDAPIMQIIADGDELDKLSKSILRGDNDYVLLEEMRDAAAFRLGLNIVSQGTRHSKTTIHAGNAQDIPYKMASSIIAEYGGNLKGLVSQIFRNWHYIFEFCQVPDNRGQKRLMSISELRYDTRSDKVSIHTICSYDEKYCGWSWKYHMGEDKEKMGKLQPEEFKKMTTIIKNLERRNPIMENTVVYPRYYKSQEGDKDVY